MNASSPLYQIFTLQAQAGSGLSSYPGLIGAVYTAVPAAGRPCCERLLSWKVSSIQAEAASALRVSNFAYLLQTFISRFRRIMDSSQNAYNEDTSSLVARLDELERALFQAGQKGLNDFQCWEKGQASQITVSSLVQNYGKRKFTEMDG